MFDFFDFIRDFILGGLYDLISSAFTWLITWLVTSSLETMLWALNLSWTVAESVIDSLNLTSYINQGFALIPTSMRGYAAALRLPEVVNVMMTGAIAKFTLRFIPFI